MTRSPDDISPAAAPRSRLLPVVQVVLAGFATVFLLGIAGGYLSVVLKGPDFSPVDGVVLTVTAVLLAVAVYYLWRGVSALFNHNEPMGPSSRKARNLLYLSGALGLVIGIVLIRLSGGAAAAGDILSNAPLPPAAAALLLAGLVPVAIVSLKWHQAIDEHEQAAYNFGAVAAVYVYFFLSAGWWLAWRGGFIPAPDGAVIFLVVCGVWLAAWLIRRGG